MTALAGMSLGFIGLGLMGKPMARGLMAAGAAVIRHNRRRAGVEELAREFEPCAATIHGWIKQADRDVGSRSTGLTSDAHDELRRLRRENRRLRQERDILAKAAAWFAQSDVTSSRSFSS